MLCALDFKECAGTGIFVSRDPSNNCRFKPCPEKLDALNEKETVAGFTEAPEPTEIQCPSDFKECAGSGIFVSRDPSNNCRFKPCSETKEEIDPDRHQFSSLIEAAMQGKKTNQLESFDHNTKAPAAAPANNDEGLVVCTQDVIECRDGTFVSRDPSNSCRFKPCANSIATLNGIEGTQHDVHSKTSIANSISESLGGLHNKGSDTTDTVKETSTDSATAETEPNTSDSIAKAMSASSGFVNSVDPKTRSSVNPDSTMNGSMASSIASRENSNSHQKGHDHR